MSCFTFYDSIVKPKLRGNGLTRGTGKQVGGRAKGRRKGLAGWLESFVELKYLDFTTLADLWIFQACSREVCEF